MAELELCKVRRDERAVIFFDTRTNPNHVAVFLAAGKALAGTVSKLKFLTAGEFDWALMDAYTTG
jgi:hypothetical protein